MLKRYGYVMRYGTSYDYPQRESVHGTDYSVMGFDRSTATL
jgi:hypothetical protein